MGKRTIKTVILLLVFLLILFCGTTFALMLRQTDFLNNQLEAAEVTCAVVETFQDNTKNSIAVSNTGTIDAYLRVRLVSYWVDSNGNIVSKPSQTPTVSPASGWVTGSDNTYYYSDPIAPGAATANLLSAAITLIAEDGYQQVVEVFADAIQSKPVHAVTDSWGVTIANGKISAAP